MSRTGSTPKRRGDACLHQFDDPRHGGFGIIRLHKIEVAVARGPGEVGNGAPVDLVRAGDDPAVGGLAEDLGQTHDRNRAGSDDVGQDLTRPDGGELVDVADDQQRGMIGDGLISACISRMSTMEVSSTTSKSHSSRLSVFRLKPPPFGSTSSSRWMVLASNPVASVMRLAARPVGAHSNRLTPLAARMRKIELTMVVLPTPGPPVMTSTFDKRANRIAAT